MSVLLAGVVLSVGGSVGLLEDDTIEPQWSAEHVPEPGSSRRVPSPGVVVVPGLLGIATVIATRRRSDGFIDDLDEALALDPIVIFVPGHGDGPAEEVFADLIDQLGIDPASARFFDYRFASDAATAETASQEVGIDDAAKVLNAYVAGVAAGGRPVYIVGFSKGAVTVAEMLADWDDGHFAPEGVIGAALLDPPMAVSLHGWLQSLGRFIGPIPDDGGYDPVNCAFAGFWCTDDRDHLGVASGVNVMVLRNPKAAVTNFGDLPEGLRVYEAPDEGPGFLDRLPRNPFEAMSRASEAHRAVLHDPNVAACIASELKALGSCDSLTQVTDKPPLPALVFDNPILGAGSGEIGLN